MCPFSEAALALDVGTSKRRRPMRSVVGKAVKLLADTGLRQTQSALKRRELKACAEATTALCVAVLHDTPCLPQGRSNASP